MSKDPVLKQPILLAAVRLARTHGLRGLKRRDIATEAGCATGTVNWHFQTMDSLRRAVVEHAKANEILDVLARAWAERSPFIVGRIGPVLLERVRQHIVAR